MLIKQTMQNVDDDDGDGNILDKPGADVGGNPNVDIEDDDTYTLLFCQTQRTSAIRMHFPNGDDDQHHLFFMTQSTSSDVGELYDEIGRELRPGCGVCLSPPAVICNVLQRNVM